MSQIPDNVAQFLAAHGLSPLEFEPVSPSTAEAAGTDATGVPLSPERLAMVTGGVQVRVTREQNS
jgi:hypothetical protein